MFRAVANNLEILNYALNFYILCLCRYVGDHMSSHLSPKSVSVSVSVSECDIRENFDTNECPNIIVSTKLHEWISEYIHIHFFDTVLTGQNNFFFLSHLDRPNCGSPLIAVDLESLCLSPMWRAVFSQLPQSYVVCSFYFKPLGDLRDVVCFNLSLDTFIWGSVQFQANVFEQCFCQCWPNCFCKHSWLEACISYSCQGLWLRIVQLHVWSLIWIVARCTKLRGLSENTWTESWNVHIHLGLHFLIV